MRIEQKDLKAHFQAVLDSLFGKRDPDKSFDMLNWVTSDHLGVNWLDSRLPEKGIPIGDFCSSTCCLAGASMLINPGVNRITLTEEGGLGHLFGSDGLPVTEYEYSEAVFGEDYDDITIHDNWPLELINLYDSGSRAEAGAIALAAYVFHHFGFTLDLPEGVNSTGLDLVDLWGS